MTRLLEQLRRPLVLLAMFAMVWAVARACVQAVTIDEAQTFDMFVGRPAAAQWEPASNNHVLISVLMRLATMVLGLSHVSVRLPALLGALLYICAAYWLATMVSGQAKVQIPLFLCLVYNPFVFDYFTVGRGYSLALAGLLGALAMALWGEKRRVFPMVRVASIASVLLGVSFSANFSFAFVDFAALGLLAFWAFLRGPRKGQALAGAIVPMLAVTFFFSSYTLLHWPKGQLWDGATTWGETFRSVAHDSLYQLNPHILNPLLLGWLERVQHFLLPAAGITMAVQLTFCAMAWRRAEDRWLWTVVCGAIIPLGIALVAHGIAHSFFGLLLPRNRTAIYVVPLVTLALGALTSMPGRGRVAALAGLWALAGSFLFSLRLSYTQEWQYLADVKDVYWGLEYLSRAHHVHEVNSNWRYGASLDFYRRRYGGQDFNLVWSADGPFVVGKQAYVLFAPIDESYADLNHLAVVYRGLDTGVMIAVDPEVDPGAFGPSKNPDLGLLYDDTDKRIEFSGKWVRDREFPAASSGTVTYSNTPGDKFRFPFEGAAVTLLYTKMFNRGLAEVLVDGRPQMTLDMYSPQIEYQHKAAFGPLTAGKHVIEVRVKGAKNEHSTDQIVDVDAIEVR
jgi:hypothetical protein